MEPRPIPTAPLDGTQILRLLKSAALTQAMSESVSIEWKTTDMGWASPLYAIASLMGKEAPGRVELNMKTGKELLPRVEQLLGMYLQGADRAMSFGPAALHGYLTRVEGLRDRNRTAINAALRDVQGINQDVAAQLGAAIQTAAFIKASATIALTLIGGGISLCSIWLGSAAAMGVGGAGAAAWGATAGMAGKVGMGYGIAGALVKNWNEVPVARATVISPAVTDVGKEFVKWNDWADWGLEKLQDRAASRIDLHQRAANFLNQAIRRRADQLMLTAPGPAQQQAQNTLNRFVAANARANQAMVRPRVAFGALGALRGYVCVYAAYSDLKGAIEEYRETVDGLR